MCISCYTVGWELQDTKDWLKGGESKAIKDSAQAGPQSPDKSGSVPWGEAKADASWGSPEKEQLEVLDNYGYDDVFDDESDFTVVEGKKKKKGKQAAGVGTVPRGRGRRRV